jgi:transcriptional regulator with XRE-family HTH domain
MPQVSSAARDLPAAAEEALHTLGQGLAMARKRRGESLRSWALRMQVSVPTLMRLEKGDPTVSMGVYATALWLLNRHDALARAADPREDLAALEIELERARQRHAPRQMPIAEFERDPPT